RGALSMDVRSAGEGVAVVDITGEVTGASEPVLMDAFSRATSEDTRAVILNFAGLDYMNSGGIGLLVTMLVRATRPPPPPMARGDPRGGDARRGAVPVVAGVGVPDRGDGGGPGPGRGGEPGVRLRQRDRRRRGGGQPATDRVGRAGHPAADRQPRAPPGPLPA